MSKTRQLITTAALAALTGTILALAATPPALINYQGVLKDKTTGMPLNATVSAVFTFYPDAASTGTDILSDAHTGIVVSNGLFSLQLGGGVLADGAGAGSHASLSEVFRDFSEVWLEVKVGTETLSPRVRVAAAAYAMNASQLEGRPASEFINTSDLYQSVPGTLQADRLTSQYSNTLFSNNGNVYTGGLDAFSYVSDYGPLYVGGTMQVDGPTTLNAPVSANAGLAVASGQPLQFGDGTAVLSGRSPLQIATLHWYGASAQTTFAVGNNPENVAFDGSSIWVTNSGSNSVTKLRASDGTVLGTFPAGITPLGVAFDGSNIWIANNFASTVTKLRASDGVTLGTFSVGSNPRSLAFDGSAIWVANAGSNNVTKLRASDGANLGTFPVGTAPWGVAFDGSSIWAVNLGSHNLTRLRASDGANLGTIPAGSYPAGAAFDGSSLWVANNDSGTVTRLRSDGAVLGTYSVGVWPVGVVFDGSSIWVANYGSGSVTKLRASDGTNLGTFPVGSSPYGIAFDGSSVWVANYDSNTVSKL